MSLERNDIVIIQNTKYNIPLIKVFNFEKNISKISKFSLNYYGLCAVFLRSDWGERSFPIPI